MSYDMNPRDDEPMNKVEYEHWESGQKARAVALEYDLHCEAIDDPDIEKLTELIAAAIQQAILDERDALLPRLEWALGVVRDHYGDIASYKVTPTFKEFVENYAAALAAVKERK